MSKVGYNHRLEAKRAVPAAEIRRANGEEMTENTQEYWEAEIEKLRGSVASCELMVRYAEAALRKARAECENQMWRGQKIPIPRRGLGGAGEGEKAFEKASQEAEKYFARTGRQPWDIDDVEE